MKAVYSIVFVAVFLVLFTEKSVAQEYYQASARSKSLAGVSVCLADGWSAFGNQAGLSVTEYPLLGISYSNYFFLKELSLKSALGVIPVDGNVFAVSFYQYGNEAYNENKCGIAYSKKLAPGFSAGLQFNYFFISLPENDKSHGDFCFEGGIQYQFSEKILVGMHCYNPFQSGIRTESYKYKLPCLFRFGFSTRIADELWLYGEIEKDFKHDLLSRFGLEYRIFSNFQLRGGIAGKNNLVSMGIGYSFKHIVTDFSWQYNYRLGSTPSLSITYQL